MRKYGVLCVALALASSAGASKAEADVWDVSGDDAPGVTRNELVHGADQVHDLAARPGPVPDEDWFRLGQQRLASYEIVVDAISGDLGPSGPILDLIANDGTTVLQSSVPAGAGKSRALRFENFTAGAVNDQRLRVRSAGCGSGCGSEDTYRIRALDTTYTIARFNNSGTQVTLIVLQNPSPDPVVGHLNFWTGAGAQLMNQPFSVAGHGAFVFNSSALLPGANGSVTVSHNGAYGQLAGRATSVEPATGFTFDTLMVPRPMPIQGTAGGRGAPALVVTPPSGDYGAVFLGGSRTVAFTVRNIGAISTGTLAVGLSGPQAAEFSLTGDTCTGTALSNGEACAIQARLTPASAGPKSAVLTIGGSPGGLEVPLSGSGVNGNPVFVTSTTHTGNLGGLAGADAICQARAAAGGLPPGTYVAWLSTSTVDASTRLGAARGFVRTDGKPFADTQTSLLANYAILNPIRTDENGATVSSDDVWTGTFPTGSVVAACNDWTSSSGAVNGSAGVAQGGPVAWTFYNLNTPASPPCSSPMHLYCFRTDLNFPIVIPPSPDRQALLSIASFVPGGGIAAADALCAAEAGAGYKAFLATTTGSAASRFNLATSPYRRPDQVRVGGAAELGSGSSLQSGIWQFLSGAYVSQLVTARWTWTGAFAPHVVGTVASTCNDWTSTSGSGFVGDPTLASPKWFGLTQSPDCSLARRIYCLQN